MFRKHFAAIALALMIVSPVCADDRLVDGVPSPSDATVSRTAGKSELVQTDLVEDGKPVRLEVVIFKPGGTGPFPLAVINHGSTGTGRIPELFGRTWFNAGLAGFLNARGWMVAFPQRRGRGNSEGLYDEGFAANRKRGYICDTDIALSGADRALSDIDAAITALRRRPDVATGPILIGGQSRGGVLAVAYAGLHPEQIRGVVNFVGGWLGENCPVSSAVNRSLFERGAHYGQPTIWLTVGTIRSTRLRIAGRTLPPSRSPAAAGHFWTSIFPMARDTCSSATRTCGRARSTII